MRISLRAVVGCTLLLLAAFVCWSYLASLRESPVRWVEGGLALSEEVWGQLRSLWDEVQRYVYWILGVYVVVAALTVFFEENNPDRANLWLFTLLLFPYVGLAAYLFFGPNVQSVPHRWRVFRSSRRRSKNGCVRAAPEAANGLERLLEVSSGAVPTHGNSVRILLDGEQTFSAIEEALASARRAIHLEYFSVAHDGLGTRIKDLLIDRARAGVEVRFLYDAVGSWHIGR
ncbi:MAG: PLDc N-terminal domain-containing protein, partial [Fretibacterium sp.]